MTHSILSTTMTYEQLMQWIDLYGPVDIEFSANAENMESYPEKGIKARVQSITKDKNEDDVLHMNVSYDGFEVVNSLFESASYYDCMSRPRLRAAAAGFYKSSEKLYVTRDMPLSEYISNIKAAASAPTNDQIIAAIDHFSTASPTR